MKKIIIKRNQELETKTHLDGTSDEGNDALMLMLVLPVLHDKLHASENREGTTVAERS
jgi:hypothetical protein